MTIGERLLDARRKRGLTRGAVSRSSGVAYETLKQLENDEQQQKNLRLMTVVGLVDALAPDITLDDFLEGVPLNRIDRFVVKLRRAS